MKLWTTVSQLNQSLTSQTSCQPTVQYVSLQVTINTFLPGKLSITVPLPSKSSLSNIIAALTLLRLTTAQTGNIETQQHIYSESVFESLTMAELTPVSFLVSGGDWLYFIEAERSSELDWEWMIHWGQGQHWLTNKSMDIYLCVISQCLRSTVLQWKQRSTKNLRPNGPLSSSPDHQRVSKGCASAAIKMHRVHGAKFCVWTLEK